jgi:hypothetical protein
MRFNSDSICCGNVRNIRSQQDETASDRILNEVGLDKHRTVLMGHFDLIRRKAFSCAFLHLFAVLLPGLAAPNDQRLIIHEWGTFTALQDEEGSAVAGVNTDDEPVPRWVHRIGPIVYPSHEIPGHWKKGAPACHPGVTIRLETPVVYFYPPDNWDAGRTLDVAVDFKGGWITEYFPQAEVNAPGFPKELLPTTHSTLSWSGITLGGEGKLKETTDHVWLAPRKVQSAMVNCSDWSEKYLFYRGVGNVNAPLRIKRDANNDRLLVYGQWPPKIPLKSALSIKKVWLTQILKDGRCAYLEMDSVALQPGSVQLAHLPSSFKSDDFSTNGLSKLRRAIRVAIVDAGLYEDEAEALLNTWERSYFKSHGFRLFFLVPESWTDYVLPLRISAPAEITRIMIGRIELITPEQRAALGRIAAGPAPNLHEWMRQLNIDLNRSSKVSSGEKPLAYLVTEGGPAIPELYQTYLDLGRFRNALLLDEYKRRPTESLKHLMRNEIGNWRKFDVQ